ncbi:MAG: hypothetical protein AAGJ28_04730 [Pseudomonadota bacterium]
MADTAFQPRTQAGQWLGAIANVLGNGLVQLGELSAGARAARYAGNLAKLSDEELAARGLKRDQIVEHAFGDLVTS